MVDLLAIVPPHDTVMVAGQAVDIFPISAADFGALQARFPELAKGTENPGNTFAAALIAAGTGHAGEPAHEAVAARLGAELQAEFIDKIMKLSLPRAIKNPSIAAALPAAAATKPAGKRSRPASPRRSKS